MRTAVLCCALAGCTYRPGSFGTYAKTFPGERMTIGCLDLAVDRRADLAGAAVLEYSFGNRCTRAVPIELARVVVIGRTVDGEEVSLRPYDPRVELEPKLLDARLVGREAIAYPATRSLVQVCADVARISEARQPSRWVCFGDAKPAAAPRSVVPADERLAIEPGSRTRIDDDDAEEAP